MKISFKTKPQTLYKMDDSVACQYVKVPEIKRSHVDMHAARCHPKYAAYANSDMFPSMLVRAVRDYLQLSSERVLRLDRVPEGVTLREVGPLVEISFHL